MKKLNKAQMELLRKLREEVRSYQDDLEAEIHAFNEHLDVRREKVESALSDLNTKIEEANSFIEEVRSEMESYFDEKDEKWQEGEKGEAFQSWMQEWDNELETLDEIDFPEHIDVTLAVADTFDQFPEEINE